MLWRGAAAFYSIGFVLTLYALDKDILNPNLAISAKPFPKSLTAGMFCNEFGLYAITYQTRYCNSFASSLLLYPMKIRHSSIKIKIKNIVAHTDFDTASSRHQTANFTIKLMCRNYCNANCSRKIILICRVGMVGVEPTHTAFASLSTN